LLGVASGNLESVGWHKIEAARLRQFFSFGFYSDRCETRAGIFQTAVKRVRQALGPEARTCFIGDTPADVRAAKEIGALIVAGRERHVQIRGIGSVRAGFVRRGLRRIAGLRPACRLLATPKCLHGIAKPKN
jgi:beta-phosphoglucomutase-like phosphatase (HAD superfamily)